jgi:hypothetical protein
MYPHCKYSLLLSVQPLPLLSLTSFLLYHYSTAFNTYHYIPNLHKCYVFWYCCLSFVSIEKFHYYKHVLCRGLSMIMFYIYLLGLSVWEKTFGLCLSEPGLIQLTQCLPIASNYLRTTWCHFSLWLNKTLSYTHIYIFVCIYITYISHFFDPFTSYRASRLLP